ncbi:transposable element Tc1 transposase [Trichonephila clavipes]|nr:transposable element Tc1 transposase [Trichonephila clavipes]
MQQVIVTKIALNCGCVGQEQPTPTDEGLSDALGEVRSLLATQEGTLISGGQNQLKAWDSHQRFQQLAAVDFTEGDIRALQFHKEGGASLYVGTNNAILEGTMQSSFKILVQEDFGKRNMPGKRAKRHFSQLSEFEIGLIIGVKTAGQVDRSECAVRNCWELWIREGTHVRKTESRATRKTTRREDRRIVRQALVDPTVTRSTIRADVGVAIVPQTIFRHLAEANLKYKRPFRALPLTPEHRQLRLQWCQARSMWNVTDWPKGCV